MKKFTTLSIFAALSLGMSACSLQDYPKFGKDDEPPAEEPQEQPKPGVQQGGGGEKGTNEPKPVPRPSGPGKEKAPGDVKPDPEPTKIKPIKAS